MKITKVVGIDIGNYRIKVSYVVKGVLKKFFYENIPDNAVSNGMIQYWDAMSQFLKETLKAHGIRCKNVVFTIPMNGVYIRKVELPLMTTKQLDLNLPFEFHDYISEESNKYFYDYSVIERDDKSMKLLAVACSKELINKYRKLAKTAKLNPIGLVPSVIGLERILQKHNEHFGITEEKDYAILDMGDSSFKIHFFRNAIYDVTRSFEPGAKIFAETISELNGTDIHISHLTEEDNLDNIQSHPSLVQIYESRAVEIMRALNFYSYSNTGNTIDTLYYCGGGSNIKKLVKTLNETINLPVKPLGYLIAVMDDELRNHFITGPQSYGVTIDPEYKLPPLAEDKLAAFQAHIDEYDRAQKAEFDKLDAESQELADKDELKTVTSLPEHDVTPKSVVEDNVSADDFVTTQDAASTTIQESTVAAVENVVPSVSDDQDKTISNSNDDGFHLDEHEPAHLESYDEPDDAESLPKLDDSDELPQLDDSDDTLHSIDDTADSDDKDYNIDDTEKVMIVDDMDYDLAMSRNIEDVEDETNKTIAELTAQVQSGHSDL